MIEERALVVATGKDYVWVETQRRTACSACAVQMGCSSGSLAKLLDNRHTRVRALTSISLQVGDKVIIGLSESALLKSSLAVYVAPLLLMLLGALLGQTVFSVASEEMVILLGILGLAAGFVWLHIFTWGIRADTQFQPVVLRRLIPEHFSALASPLSLPME